MKTGKALLMFEVALGVIEAVLIAYLAIHAGAAHGTTTNATVVVIGNKEYTVGVNESLLPRLVNSRYGMLVCYTDYPAGISYAGPPTTALAAYYCVLNESTGYIVLPPGAKAPQFNYTIQLNAFLSNHYWVQDVLGGQVTNGVGVLGVNVWHGSDLLLGGYGPPIGQCGWLVIAVINATAYIGYSTDGTHVSWYANYPVGNAVIVNGSYTNLVIAGGGDGAGVAFKDVLTVLALYYWNGTAWAPAPVNALTGDPGTGEFVVNAWVFTVNNTAVVTWPKPVMAGAIVPQPTFKP